MLTLASVVGGPQSMTKSHFGLIGLGVMGENLVLNAERNGFSSVVYNRTYSKALDGWWGHHKPSAKGWSYGVYPFAGWDID